MQGGCGEFLSVTEGAVRWFRDRYRQSSLFALLMLLIRPHSLFSGAVPLMLATSQLCNLGLVKHNARLPIGIDSGPRPSLTTGGGGGPF